MSIKSAPFATQVKARMAISSRTRVFLGDRIVSSVTVRVHLLRIGQELLLILFCELLKLIRISDSKKTRVLTYELPSLWVLVPGLEIV
jgi:hypothetical protein